MGLSNYPKETNFIMSTNLTAKISPSSIGDLSCAKRFHVLRVLKQWPPRDPLSFASFSLAFYDLIGRVYNPANGPAPNVTHLDTWSRQAFKKHRYANEDAREEDRARCVRMVLGYIAQDDIEDAEGTICTEQFLEFDFNHDGRLLFILSGRLDRILVRVLEPDVLTVRDYKLSRPKVDLESAYVTLLLAKLAYPGYKTYRAEYDFIDEGARLDREIVTVSDIKGMHKAIMERARRVILNSEKPAEPSERCQFCPLRPTCQPQLTTAISVDADIFDE